MANLVITGARWFSVKWWTTNGREDLAERAALSVETLRKAGFLARVGTRINEDRMEYARRHNEEPDQYASLVRVEVFGTSEVHNQARDHLRGFWAAIESRGMKPDYREGYTCGASVLRALNQPKAAKLPKLTKSKLLCG